MSLSCQKSFQIMIGTTPPPCPFPSSSLTLDADTLADLNFLAGTTPHFTGTMANLVCGSWAENPGISSSINIGWNGTVFLFNWNVPGYWGTYTQDVPSSTDPTGAYTYSTGFVIPHRAPPYLPGQLHITIS